MRWRVTLAFGLAVGVLAIGTYHLVRPKHVISTGRMGFEYAHHEYGPFAFATTMTTYHIGVSIDPNRTPRRYVGRNRIIIHPGRAALTLACYAMLATGTVIAFRWLTGNRLPASACPACGYDLRGTRAAGRDECPECGAAVDRD